MPKFTYKAKSGPGKTVEGELIADSKTAAVAKLEAMGCSPIWVAEKDDADSGAGRRISNRRISRRDVTMFTRQLSSLTKSGVPILRSLATIGEQTENGRFRRVVQNLEATIRDGNMLSGAISKYPKLFSDLYVNMVRSGEAAGVLDTALARLAEARERDDELRRKVQAAVAYPLLIVSVGIITVFVLLTFFLPRVVGLFKNYKDLPLPTQILIGISEFCSRHWYWVVIAVLLIGAIVNRVASLDKGRAWFDGIKIRLPLLGNFIVQSEIARFARTLSLLLEAGIPIDKALALSGDTLQNKVLKHEVEEIRKNTVLQGVALSAGIKRSRVFPPLVANMAAVGEEAGRLDEALQEVAFYYEKDVEQQTRLATSLLEPILILVVGGMVGLIVAAMLLPIFKLSSGL